MDDNDPTYGSMGYVSPQVKSRRSRDARRSSILDGLATSAEEQLTQLEDEDNTIPSLNFPPVEETTGDSAYKDSKEELKEDEENSTPGVTTVIIDGEEIEVRTQRLKASEFRGHKAWNKKLRVQYNSEELSAFIKSAQRCVLSKGNKLKVFSVDLDDEKKLDHVRNFGLQLKLLKAHLVDHDIYDVFKIVIPKDISSIEFHRETYDLFLSYPKLTAKIVANSCAWYNGWAFKPYYKENMKLSFELLRVNTDEHLFNKTLETYEQFPEISRGGPLMAHLLFDKILTTTESAIEVLVKKIENLKIRDQIGEDIDSVVSLIRSTVDVLHSASDENRCYVPDDFPKLVLKVFQSSSNKEFNETFAEEQRTVQREADRTGKKPQWPAIEGTLLQAERVYYRLVTETKWCVSASKRRHALNASTSGPPDYSRQTCFNCEELGCSVEICKKPKDQKRINANRKKFLDSKRRTSNSSSSRSGGASPRRDEQGRPLKPNKNGIYVVDTKKLKSERDPASTPAPAPAPTPAPSAHDAATIPASNTSSGNPARQAQLARTQDRVNQLYGPGSGNE